MMDAAMIDVVSSRTAKGTMTTPDNPINKSNLSTKREKVLPNVPPNVKYSNGSSIVIFFSLALAFVFLSSLVAAFVLFVRVALLLVPILYVGRLVIRVVRLRYLRVLLVVLVWLTDFFACRGRLTNVIVDRVLFVSFLHLSSLLSTLLFFLFGRYGGQGRGLCLLLRCSLTSPSSSGKIVARAKFFIRVRGNAGTEKIDTGEEVSYCYR